MLLLKSTNKPQLPPLYLGPLFRTVVSNVYNFFSFAFYEVFKPRRKQFHYKQEAA